MNRKSKLGLAGLILGVSLGCNAQQKQEPQVQQYQAPFSLSPRDVIDILSEYSVKYVDIPMNIPSQDSSGNTMDLYGIVKFNSKIIYINENTDFAQKKHVVLHEFLHVKARQLGIKLSEEQIDEMASFYYQALYSGK